MGEDQLGTFYIPDQWFPKMDFSACTFPYFTVRSVGERHIDRSEIKRIRLGLTEGIGGRRMPGRIA